MNKTVENFYGQLKETILRAKAKKDLLKFDSILLERKEWLESYNETDKKQIIEWMIEKDKEITGLLQEKKDTLREKISQEEEQNRNRGTFKLYE